MIRRAPFLAALAASLAAAALPALADTVVAARTLRAGTVLGPADLAVAAGDTPGALTSPDQGLGMEAKVNLYAGRPVHMGDLGAPALVERNQIVPLAFSRGGLRIVTDGRALDRAGVGDRVRVMNLGSRTTVTGTVTEDGAVVVSSDSTQFASR